MTDPTLPPAELLQHAAFLRRLAFHLLRDDADADDATQETLARALGSPPRPGPGLRAWLVAVLRNVVRMDARSARRRQRRELRVARSEAGPGADAGAGRAEILHVVANAVRALEPALQEVVMLRHYRGLPPREISAQLGVPLQTVKGRLRRAHERLRDQLTENAGGNVEGWRSSLVLVVGLDTYSRTAGTSAAGGVAVGTATKVGLSVAASVLLAVGGWYLVRLRSGSSSPGQSPPSAVEVGADAAAGSATALAAHPPALPVVTGAQATKAPAEWGRKMAGVVSLLLPPTWNEQPGSDTRTRTWAPEGEAVPSAVSFSVMPSDEAQALRSSARIFAGIPKVVDGYAASLSRGRDDGSGMDVVIVTLDGAAHGAPDAAFVWTFPPLGAANLAPTFDRIFGSIKFLPSRGEISGSDEPDADLLRKLAVPVEADAVEGVVLLGRTPLEGVRVSLDPLPRTRWDDPSLPLVVQRQAITRADGTFLFAHVPSASYQLLLELTGNVRRRMPVPSMDRGQRRRLVVVLGGGEVSGRVFDRTGRALASAEVFLWPKGATGPSLSTTTGPDGEFRFDHVLSGSWELRTVLASDRAVDIDKREDYLTLGPGEFRRIDLGTSTPEPLWTGVLRLSSGTVARGRAWISLTDASGRRSEMVISNEDGTISRRLPAGSWRVRSIVQDGLVPSSMRTPLEVSATGLVQDIVIPGSQVTGWVRDTKDSPIVQQELRALIRVGISRAGNPGEDPAPSFGWSPVRSDGQFAISGVPAGRYRIEAFAGPTAPFVGSDAVVEVGEGRDAGGVVLYLRPK